MKKTALITGASSGIGKEFAELLARDGYDLILVARHEDELKKVSDTLREKFSISTKIMAKDLSNSSAPDEIFDEIKKNSIEVGVLVNNAGFGSYGSFIETDLKTSLDLFLVNITALTHLTSLFVPLMVKNGGGKVLNVASVAAFPPGPYMNVYYSTKAYVLSFSVALNEELRGKNVSVTALCPGPTETNFQKRIGLKNGEMFSIKSMDAKSVAKAGYDGLKSGKTIVVPGFINKVTTFILRFISRSSAAKFVGKGQIVRK
jgi:short-subunit dehydrogenase